MENTATLFSPPLNTFLPPISSVPELRLVMVDEAAVRMDVDGAGHLACGVWLARSASAFLMNIASRGRVPSSLSR